MKGFIRKALAYIALRLSQCNEIMKISNKLSAFTSNEFSSIATSLIFLTKSNYVSRRETLERTVQLVIYGFAPAEALIKSILW